MNKKIKKIDGKSINNQEEMLDYLQKKMPEIFSEGKVDCEKLKLSLGENVESSEERYGLTWAGKSGCFAEIQRSITKTLKPDKEESKDFDNTKNIYIEGDNLEALKILQRSYYGKVKMIYIDPPYNTGNDFVYNDKFASSKKEYQEEAGITDKAGNILRDDGLRKNSKDSGHYHSDWLNMMYPRLFLARNLLKDDGVIFISIDDNEVANLRKICDEIFGEENFVGEICRVAKKGGNKGDFIKPKKDYLLFYFKNIEKVCNYGYLKDTENVEWKEESFNGIKRKYVRGDIPYREKLEVRPNQRYYIEAPDGSLMIPKGNVFPEIKKDSEQVMPQTQVDKCWTWSRGRYLKEKENDRFIFLKSSQSPFLDEKGERSKWTVYKKVFYEEYIESKEILTDLIDNCENAAGTRELEKINIPFDYPKPSKLIAHLAKAVTSENDIVLDFFSGSSTTAHAVMQLNAEDGGNRKCISIQLPELTDEKSEAFKAGYKNIAQIGRERIRRAGDKILEDNKDKKVDIGFKAFRVAESNFRIWQNNITDIEELKKQLELSLYNVNGKSSQEEILFELILKSGLDLNSKIEEVKVGEKKYYRVNGNKLSVCLEKSLDKNLMETIIKEKPTKIICLDIGFKGDDQLKTNAVLQAENNKIDFRAV